MNLKRNNYNIGGNVTVKWGINEIACIITGIETVLGAPTELVYTVEPLGTTYDYRPEVAGKRGKKQIYAFLVTEDGCVYNTVSRKYENPGSAKFQNYTNTETENAILTLFKYMPKSTWEQGQPSDLRLAKDIALNLIFKQDNHASETRR